MRTFATPTIGVIVAALILTGCATDEPDDRSPRISTRQPESVSPVPAPSVPESRIYSADEALDLLLIYDDYELGRLGFEMDSEAPNVGTGALDDFYGESGATETVTPSNCGPAYWLAVVGKSDIASGHSYIVSPELQRIHSSLGPTPTSAVDQSIRVFPEADAAEDHFSAVKSALSSCANFQVSGQGGEFTFSSDLVGSPTVDTIQLTRGYNPDAEGGVADSTTVRDTAWIFLKSNLIMIIDADSALGDVSNLVSAMKARLDALE